MDNTAVQVIQFVECASYVSACRVDGGDNIRDNFAIYSLTFLPFIVSLIAIAMASRSAS